MKTTTTVNVQFKDKKEELAKAKEAAEKEEMKRK